MRDVRFVTTFSEKCRISYANKMMESWEQNSSYPLRAYVEDDTHFSTILYNNVSPHRLGSDIIKRLDNVRGILNINNYRLEFAGFARKIVALRQFARDIPFGWLVWIDADTKLINRLDEIAIKEILQEADAEGCCCAYLGRKNWSHSECGFVAYNLRTGGMCIIENVYDMYDTFDFLKLPEWHDSYVFDHVRKNYSERFKFFDLSHGLDLGNVKEKGIDALNIWPHTVLGKYFIHYKGNLKSNKC